MSEASAGLTWAALHRLVSGVAPLMPSAAAIPQASIEWREARVRWLEAIAALGTTEAKVRAGAELVRQEAVARELDAAGVRGRA